LRREKGCAILRNIKGADGMSEEVKKKILVIDD